MVEHLSGIQQSALHRVSIKKHVSMATTNETKEIGSSQALDSLKQMRTDVEKAFSLMGEVRSRLEVAYHELSR
ncbi:MAG: hypothetical protein JSS62_03290 [Verrucomicrobia bacterium]|nr:hypothetical protein [Verrucomicrobiota bacterium]MBS0646694.1 hypothetical protein [Verrucomicrobiota bacterium]